MTHEPQTDPADKSPEPRPLPVHGHIQTALRQWPCPSQHKHIARPPENSHVHEFMNDSPSLQPTSSCPLTLLSGNAVKVSTMFFLQSAFQEVVDR